MPRPYVMTSMCIWRVWRRIVTTGPMFLLGLLGITFYLGSRQPKTRVSEQPIIHSHSWAGSSANASARELARVSGMFSSTNEAVNRTSRHDTSRSNTGPLPDQGLPADATGVTSSGAPAAGVGDATEKRQASRIIHVPDESTAEPGRNASDSQDFPLERPIVRSEHSLRRLWQGGPGNETNSEQVKRRWVCQARRAIYAHRGGTVQLRLFLHAGHPQKEELPSNCLLGIPFVYYHIVHLYI